MAKAASRSIKTVLRTRPIHDELDEPLRGHVFCSFVALMLLKRLHARMEARGWGLHSEHLRGEFDDLQETTVRKSGKTFVIRSRTRGDTGKAIQAVGVAFGPIVRLCEGNRI